MTDEELERRLRRHYAERRAGEPEAPSFRTMLAQAERQAVRPRRLPTTGVWLIPAAAALAAVWLWWPRPVQIDALPSQEVLLAELTSGTSWQAPSDRWLPAAQPPAYLGLPRLGAGGSVLEPLELP